ncbi:MAG: HAD hydrolase-like protein [Streptosporangiales bacterium]|nr:HAD hydrolase-like protein [Streptosporangiales bacterium]
MNRLVLWNIDQTLVDVTTVNRVAYAEAFERATGRPLMRLAPTAGRTESELFHEFTARNRVEATEPMLAVYIEALADAFARQGKMLRERGRVLPGAAAAVEAVGRLQGTVQSVLTGGIRPNAVAKLRAFGLDGALDLGIGGYGSEVYPKATLLQVARNRAREKYGQPFDETNTVYVGDSPRDVEAAQFGGAASVAVAGSATTLSQLREAGADVLLEDLTDTGGLVRAIERLTSPQRTGH